PAVAAVGSSCRSRFPQTRFRAGPGPARKPARRPAAHRGLNRNCPASEWRLYNKECSGALVPSNQNKREESIRK
nr:hypothetical protein [Tanacetum cinerariifolium]